MLGSSYYLKIPAAFAVTANYYIIRFMFFKPIFCFLIFVKSNSLLDGIKYLALVL